MGGERRLRQQVLDDLRNQQAPHQPGARRRAKPGSQSLWLGSSQLVTLEQEIVEATGGRLTATCSPHRENFVTKEDFAEPLDAILTSSTGRAAPSAEIVIACDRVSSIFLKRVAAVVVHLRRSFPLPPGGRPRAKKSCRAT